LECLKAWTKALDDGHGVDVIHLNYRKAFDIVSHKRLIQKLQHYGFPAELVHWITDLRMTDG